MNTNKEFSQQVIASARSLVLGCCTMFFAACNSDPSQNTAAETVYGGGGAVSGVATAGSATVTPSNDPQPPLRDAFNAGTPNAEETAAIQRIAPGANPRAAIKNYFAALQIPPERPVATYANVLFIDASGYAQTFPGRLFYVVRFRQWPVAIEPPEPLASNNLFVFEPGTPLRLITGSRQLQEFFSHTAVAPGGEEAARLVLASWLILSAELAQDGMFRFKPPSIESVGTTADGAFEAKGRIAVEPKSGDTGEIAARIIVNSNGKLISAHTEQNLNAGIRPICQATKLLDPDPLVRKMAKRDLLVMGRSARDYLFLQRSKTPPELQAEIDRLWRQILLEGR